MPANLFHRIFQRKRSKIKQIGRYLSVYLSNLCTRHIPEKLTPRGHHDWPDKRRSVYRLRSDRRPLVQSSCSRGPRVTWTRPRPYRYQVLTAGSAPWFVGRGLGEIAAARLVLGSLLHSACAT